MNTTTSIPNLAMEPQSFLFPILVSLSLALLLKLFIKTIKTKKTPPGPWPLPILGHLHLLNPNKPHHSLQNLANKHGPLILLQLGSTPTLIISSRDIAQHIFTNYDHIFSGRPQLIGPTKIFYNSGIIFTPYDDTWRQARKITVLELLSPSRVRGFRSVRREEVEKLVRAIKDVSVANLSEMTLMLANNVVCRAALGDEFGKGGVRLRELLRESQRLIGGFCWGDYFGWMGWVDWLSGFLGRLERNFEELDEFLNGVIRGVLERGERGEGGGSEEEKDLVHVLVRLHKDAVVRGGFLSSLDHVKAILVVS